MKKLLFGLMMLPMLLVGCDDSSTVLGDDGKDGNDGNDNPGGTPSETVEYKLDKDYVVVAHGGETFDITVTANCKYDILCDGWIKDLSGNLFAAVRPTVKSFSVGRNTAGKEREGYIIFTFHTPDGDKDINVTVHQAYAPAEAGEVEGDWRNYDFVHHSLFLEFTGTWCGFCPLMARSVERVEKLYPDRFYCIAMHGGGSDLDFGSTDYFDGVYKLKSNYPRGVVDGRIKIEKIDYAPGLDEDIANAFKYTEETYPTVTGVSINSTLDDNQLHVDATVYFKAPGAYKVYAMLLESGIYTNQKTYVDGADEQYIPNWLNNNVARMMLTANMGQSYNLLQETDEADFSWDKTVKPEWNADNLSILVWVERDYGELPRNQSSDLTNLNTFVDNCTIAPVGEKYTLKVIKK